ncbi:hypothetical protein Leryth_012151 [Lithospermum erythrorhizon]|nr:hypothetical protein Leryth_012151 [Lithospermum erythrorhizon]
MERYSYRKESQNAPNPSFSASLLDSIYQSIDRLEDEEVDAYREVMKKKQQINSNLKQKNNLGLKEEEKFTNLQRLQMIEKWMEKESEKTHGRRRSLADFGPKVKENNPEIILSNSIWNSSDSNSGCRFSSSAVEESVFRVSTKMPSSSSCYGMPKPIKTNVSIQQEQPKFEKTKSRALKFYGDLKNSKQPISPGGKLASFLNSLFSSGHAKKTKTEANSERKMSKSANASTCSSAPSFSRSCLSKTPSKASNVMKRSVKFYPVSVIVDEDCQPCGHKNLYHDKNTSLVYEDSQPCGHKNLYHDRYTSLVDVNDIRCSVKEELKNHIMEKNKRVEEAAKCLLRNYHKRVELEHDLRSRNQIFIDDDDATSCASSDLFELDNINLSATGMEELPVYETTHLDTNLAIANQRHDHVIKTKNYK